MGLLFQPRWCGRATVELARSGRSRHRVRPRSCVPCRAGGGRARRCEPFRRLVHRRRGVLQPPPGGRLAVLAAAGGGSPEDSLSDVVLVVVALDDVEDKVIGEWRLEAMFTRPVLYDDRLLIEPTGGPVRLPGASVAEFRDHRIRAFRHYFDDSELLAAAPRRAEPSALVVRPLGSLSRLRSSDGLVGDEAQRAHAPPEGRHPPGQRVRTAGPAPTSAAPVLRGSVGTSPRRIANRRRRRRPWRRARGGRDHRRDLTSAPGRAGCRQNLSRRPSSCIRSIVSLRDVAPSLR